ncbi:hypothetical protein Pmani_013391 [Petrolisthes manimaculis]|uniref:Uncharacterized protein n=1 Tax=Petrolisthes manimaculis TaxID=1843537 RepID=A0AAE1PWR9_9EUCA|nr:hypothetical protein Pmani_013391 [Petrolisthes manimaculis]
MKDYSRHNNLQVIGIEEGSDSETWGQTALKVTKLLEERIQLPNINLEELTHRVEQRCGQRHRPIVIRFTRFGDSGLHVHQVGPCHLVRAAAVLVGQVLRAERGGEYSDAPALDSAVRAGEVTGRDVELTIVARTPLRPLLPLTRLLNNMWETQRLTRAARGGR